MTDRQKTDHYIAGIWKITGFILLFSALVMGLMSCGETEKMVIFTEEELKGLVSGDTIKTWLRTNVSLDGQKADLSDCEVYSLTTFLHGEQDSLIYSISQNPDFCDGNEGLIEAGIYRVNVDPLSNKGSLQFISGQDSLIKNIEEITSLFLRLRYTDASGIVEERFEAVEK